MEKEGFIRSLTMLGERAVKVQAIVKDRHTGVQKFIREEKNDITHYFDPWHMGKGTGKKIDELARKNSTQDVGQWRKSVVNHLYWSASTTSSGEEAVAKWTSVANHIRMFTPITMPCFHAVNTSLWLGKEQGSGSNQLHDF